MRRRLELSGMRSVSGIVDVDQLLMLELGQPLHAFDRSKINDALLFAEWQRSRNGDARCERRQLHSDDLLIADRKHPLAIAGVMGDKIPKSAPIRPRSCRSALVIRFRLRPRTPTGLAQRGELPVERYRRSKWTDARVEPAAELLAVIEAGGKNPAAAD